jgi:RNA polymerase sigma-70 factor (ECF subfamily)
MVDEFETFYHAYKQLVRSIIFKLCAPHDIDDVVQDTFIKIWTKRHTFKNNASFKTWIYRVAYNQAIDHQRKTIRSRKKMDQLHSVAENMSKSVPNTSQSPEQQLTGQQTLHLSLQHLEFSLRAPLVMHNLEGIPIDEVAKILEIPIGTVKSRLHTARKKLHTYLKSQGVLT